MRVGRSRSGFLLPMHRLYFRTVRLSALESPCLELDELVLLSELTNHVRTNIIHVRKGAACDHRDR